jgi:peptide/nickel transport system permease protein
MAAYLLRRLAYALLVGLGITAITFFISQVIPIDPAAAALGENAREEQIREFRERYGLDKPSWSSTASTCRGFSSWI